MTPSGEEIFSIGVTTDISVARKFFKVLTTNVNDFIRANAPFSSDYVTISFGCKIFSSEIIHQTASAFVDLVHCRQVKEASVVYLELTLMMRRELAYELDQAKFSSLNASKLDLVVFFRNVVYAKLRKYKEETRKALLALAERAGSNDKLREKLQSSIFNKRYGITDDDVIEITNLLLKNNLE